MILRRTEKIDIRVSKLEKAMIERNAQQAGVSVGSYLRDCGLNKELIKPYTPEELEVLRGISRLASGLSRIGNIIREKDNTHLHREVLELSVKLKEILIRS